jgi:Cys-tRNA(Pro)/Cys-tRNA(Cys) deacylase
MSPACSTHRKSSYQVFTYDYDAGVQSAVEVAAAIGLPPGQVFKTLVAGVDEPRRKPLLVIMPGPDTLDLKRAGEGVNAKKVKMTTHEQAETAHRACRPAASARWR